MGAATHKSLIGVHGNHGTLHLLLGTLAESQISSVTVVTGAHDEDVAKAAKALVPEARVAHNPHFAGGPMTSLRAALPDLPDGDICTFNADTVLLPDFLEALWAAPPGLTAVTIHRGNDDGSAHDVGVLEASGRILDIGPGLRTGAWMGPCVLWADADRGLLEAATGTEKQWQVLSELIRRGIPVTAVEVPADSFFDIDTEADLRRVRVRVADGASLSPDELLFRRTISKDEHPVGRRDITGTFVKTCPDKQSAATEFRVLEMLSAAGITVPRPLAVHGEVVTMELVEGIRVFDLLRVLRTVAPDVIPALLARLRERLAEVQKVLVYNRHELPDAPYPFGTKVVAMIRLLSRLLDVPAPDAAELAQWTQLSSMWRGMLDTPFRDATTKNMILAHPELSVSSPDRLGTLESITSSDPGQLLTAPIVDVDFSLCGFRSTAADDWVSLLMHEACAPWTTWPNDSDLDFDQQTLGLTLLVRYVRFGGRKMSYSLMHPGAAGIRFAYDDAGFYFRRLPALLTQVWPGFADRYPLALRRISSLAVRFDESASRSGDDWPAKRDLWQESPLELR